MVIHVLIIILQTNICEITCAIYMTFLDNPIKTICINKADEFTSQVFNAYYIASGINIEHLVAHIHTQNGPAESFIKSLQVIARLMLMRIDLPISSWGMCYFTCCNIYSYKTNKLPSIFSFTIFFWLAAKYFPFKNF